ncbi:MAG TPA: phage tail sheath C-terminal domain-containing protein [Burkholderiales bacterium]|nr:phage tail sheath C-terminal domain-containing protein [Burkholderiales bacterium]
MPAFSTPDVYVREIKVFPPSVAEVESAIPAFIGYTQIATRDAADDLRNKPTLIYSMTEFEQYFGGPWPQQLTVAVNSRPDGSKQSLVVGEPALEYFLYHSMKLFFDNGGGKCYVVSVGGYKAAPGPFVVEADLTGGLNAVAAEDEPTLLVIPEAVRLATVDQFGNVARAMLQQCQTLGDRFAILDLYDGYKGLAGTIPVGAGTKTVVQAHRENVWTLDIDILKYGGAYYPFLRTTMNPVVNAAESNVNVLIDGAAAPGVVLNTLKAPGAGQNLEVYNAAKLALSKFFLTLPPSGAIAGVYAYTDTNRGVWKAPANVPLSDVVEPVVKLDSAQQGPLNVDPTSGKSINALRAFAGKGTLVWGARTLAGNDNEWRYINVRRFFNTVEESVKKSTYWAVFETNDANTWVKVRGMIEAYLTQKWREGALAGARPQDAFFVRCGLGTTMNFQDILEGRMNVEIGMAVVRPAEFIILKFSHKMQVS